MKAVDPFPVNDPRYKPPAPPNPAMTYTADRVLVGHCPSPDCEPFGGAPLVVFNDRESWPLVACPCGWSGPTDALVNRVRLDRGWKVSDKHGDERELRP